MRIILTETTKVEEVFWDDTRIRASYCRVLILLPCTVRRFRVLKTKTGTHIVSSSFITETMLEL